MIVFFFSPFVSKYRVYLIRTGFGSAKRYPWVLKTYQYDSPEKLLISIIDIIGPAEKKANDLKK